MDTPNPGKSLFDKLPNELVAHIFERCPTLESLSSFIYTSRRSLAIFEKHAVAITEYVIHATVPRPLCLLFDAVISLRADETYETYYEAAHCMAADLDIHLPQMSTTVSPVILRKFLKLNTQIHGLAHVCLRQCIKKCEEKGLLPFMHYEVHEEVLYVTPSHLEPNKDEEERVIMGFWLLQYYMDLMYALEHEQLAWDDNDLQALHHSTVTKGVFERFELQLVGTAIATVLSLTRGNFKVAGYRFDRKNATELHYRLPDPEQLGEENILSCHNLLQPREYLEMEGVLGFYHLTVWSSTSIAAEYASQMSLETGALEHLWPEHY